MWEVFYDDKSFTDFGINMALLKNPYVAPEPNVESIHVAGRNGDLHFYNGEFGNVNVKYKCLVDHNFEANYEAFKAWILSKRGYQRLIDYTHPDYYRMGIILNPPEIGKSHDSFEITFNCKPQKYLISGDDVKEFTSAGEIYNPTEFEAKPLLRVYGVGSLTIGNQTIQISKNTTYTDIDCDLEDAYKDTENLNNNIRLSGNDFPVLPSGASGISLSGVSRVLITPRWFTI